MPSFAAVVDALNMAAAIVGAAFAVFVVIGISAIFYRDYKSSPAPVEINKRPGALRSHDVSLLPLPLFILSSALYVLSTAVSMLSIAVWYCQQQYGTVICSMVLSAAV